MCLHIFLGNSGVFTLGLTGLSAGQFELLLHLVPGTRNDSFLGEICRTVRQVSKGLKGHHTQGTVSFTVKELAFINTLPP